MLENKFNNVLEWVIPFAFIFCAGWITWHLPAFILTCFPPADVSDYDKLSALFQRIDLTPNFYQLFGGFADFLDWGFLILLPILGYIGVKTVRRASMEFEDWTLADRLAVFVGRLTMMLIVLLCFVMLYEVLLRYVFEAPTLWANELSLWLASIIFLCAGLYTMQQRSHIRILIIYQILPKSLQRVCDVLSALMIVTFAFFLCYGGYGEAFDKFYRWETFGTAFDPPIPATVKPLVLFITVLVAAQALLNLISDWNKQTVVHSSADDIGEDDIARLKASIGEDETSFQNSSRRGTTQNQPSGEN